jgi:hypothetical protein
VDNVSGFLKFLDGIQLGLDPWLCPDIPFVVMRMDWVYFLF